MTATPRQLDQSEQNALLLAMYANIDTYARMGIMAGLLPVLTSDGLIAVEHDFREAQ